MDCLKSSKGSSARSPRAAWTVGFSCFRRRSRAGDAEGIPRWHVVGHNQGVAQFLQVGQEQVGVKPEIAHPCAPKAGDHTSNRIAAESKYSRPGNFWARTILDEFVNMFGRGDHTKNEEHCEKVWRVQERMKRKDPISWEGARRKEDFLEWAI